ncbi:MAG: hypothetical protein Q8927_19460 [Bacteroidota bacterium]|nr:hypothetical protein [Bacteroidota bacterium]MDP4218382.1 hypothetical protein [Bacteroidota bacterium]MDP4255126.1 hypothetical protein [Bacteroidota bacterium]MDP4259508.1 hypothetical protein [Bacteroidota bacterium]
MNNLLSYIALLLCAAGTLSCHAKLAPQSAQAAQASVHDLEAKDSHGNPMLLGSCDRARLEQPPYDSWFVRNYRDYPIDSATADRLREALRGKRFTIFMGTWCGDSRREVPRMFRILDYCGVPASAIRLIMVSPADSDYKQSPGHEERGLNLFRVPDLLIYRDGKEMGRVVESPVVSLEKDMLTLTTGGDYTAPYQEVNYLIRLFREKGPEEIEKDLPGVCAELRPLAGSASGLISYAHVLRATGENDKAAIVTKLQGMIFPQGK